MHEPLDSAADFSRRLDEAGIDHVLIGALAAMRYRREPRLTTDADFLVREVGTLIQDLQADGFDLAVHRDDEGDPYAFFVRGKGVKVDILVAETEYQHGAIDRAIDGALTVEDVLIHKLIAWRPRDRDDIASILDNDVAYDEVHVLHWARAWEVADRWDQARRR